MYVHSAATLVQCSHLIAPLILIAQRSGGMSGGGRSRSGRSWGWGSDVLTLPSGWHTLAGHVLWWKWGGVGKGLQCWFRVLPPFSSHTPHLHITSITHIKVLHLYTDHHHWWQLLDWNQNIWSRQISSIHFGLASAVQELASNCNDVNTAIYMLIYMHAQSTGEHICMCAGLHTQHTQGVMHHHADCSHGVVQSKLQYVHRCPLHEWVRKVRTSHIIN